MKYFINPKGFVPGMAYSMANDEGVFFVTKDGLTDRVKNITKVYADNLCQDGIWKEITPEEARKLLVIDLADMRREWNNLTFSQAASVIEEIKRLEKAIPNGGGDIILHLCSDMTWWVSIEVNGRELAILVRNETQFICTIKFPGKTQEDVDILEAVNNLIPKDLP